MEEAQKPERESDRNRDKTRVKPTGKSLDGDVVSRVCSLTDMCLSFTHYEIK